MAREVTITSSSREVTLGSSSQRTVVASKEWRLEEFLTVAIAGLAALTPGLRRKQTLRHAVIARAAVAATLVMVKLQQLLVGVRAQATVTAGIGGYRPVHGGVQTATWLYLTPRANRGVEGAVAAPATFECFKYGGRFGLTQLVNAAAAVAGSVGGLRGLPGTVTAPASINPGLRNLGYLIDSASVRITDSTGADITVYA